MADAQVVRAVEHALAEERDRVNRALQRALSEWAPELPPELRPIVQDGLTAGGKRIRPVLCVAAYRATSELHEVECPDVYDLAVSLEMIHAYSLMHDDLPCMDDAPLRRGRPTPHTRFGPRPTAAAAALLIPLAAAHAYRCALRLDLSGNRARRLVATLLDAAGVRGMVGGQALDLLGEGRRLDEGQLRRLHAWKTGALLAAAPRMGGLVARAGSARLDALTQFGTHLGLAFQIADDVLDATASAEELGKQPSDDALDKSTFVSLFGLDGARKRAVAETTAATRVLRAAGIHSPILEQLALYILQRRR